MLIDQGELFKIPNPCIGVCENNARGYCKGCLRSRTERFHWNEFTDYQRYLIVQLCGQRRKRVLAAQKQKAESINDPTAQIDLFTIETDQAEESEPPTPQLSLFVHKSVGSNE